MDRRILVSLTVVLALASMPGARADDGWTSFTFAWVPPCAVACSYWIENGLQPCSNDFPPVSYQERITEPAPIPPAGKRGVALAFEIFPQVDWDAFVCTYPERELVQTLTHPIGDQCGPPGMGLIGCQESSITLAEPGKQYVLLAYNWSDPADLPARYGWLVF